MDLRSKGGGGERSTRISTSNQVPRRSSIIFVSKFGTLLLCLLFFIFFASSVQAATYYVSKAGSDSNTATQAQSQETPWLTLQHAEDTANDGDTIYVSAGTYTENDSSTHGWDVSKAITWIATGEVTVKAQTGSSYRPLTVSGTGVGSYTGFIFDGEEAKSQTAQLVAGSSNKTFTNCTFKGATSWLVYAVDTSNLTVQNSTFESTNSAVTIVKGGALTNAVFENNTFNITAASLVASAINTVTFNSNTINATLSGTMFTSGARTGDYVLSNNVIILGGTPVSIQASGATDAGTTTWDSNDITVSSVTSGPVFNLFRGATNISFTNNDIKVEDPSQTQVVIYLNNQTSPVITGNTVETFNNTGTISAVVSVGSSDGTGGGIPQIKNNVIKARHSSGKIISVGTEGSTAGDNTYDGAIIENNTLYGPLYYDPDLNGVTNHAIFVGYNKNASIKYNTVIGGGYGVVVKGGGMAYTGGGIFYNKFIDCVGIASVHVKGIQDINVYNNTIFAQDSFVGPYYLIWIKQNAAGELGTGASLRNNIIYGGTGSNRNIYIGSESISGFSSDYNLLYRHDGDSYGYNGMTDYDFSEWQGLGYDLHSIDNDPAFIETNGLDFRLSYSSPAINTGTDVSQALDYIGSTVPQGSTPDIGAYEFLTPSSSPLSLAQYKSDGTTILTTSTINSENTVVLKFTMASSNPLDLLTPQIEIQKVGTNFTNSVTHTGTAVSYSGSSVIGTVTVTDLADGSYHWQARTSNPAGQSSWVTYDGNFATDINGPSTSSTAVQINIGGKTYDKYFSPLSIPDLSSVGDNDHPQFCFSKAYDTAGGSGISSYTVRVDGRNYLTNIPYNAPSADGNQRRDDGEHAIIEDGDEYWYRYSNYDRPSETQEICAYGKGDAKRLHPGLHTWSVRSVDNAGNSVETEIRRFLVKTSSGSFSSSGAGWGDVQTQDQPGFSQGEWFPVSILQIGNRSYTNELSTLSPRMFSVEDPISITTPNPTFYGIAVSGSKITLTLDKEYYDLSTKTTKQEQVAKQVTTANDSSEWGINLTDNVVTLAEYTTEERLHYFVTVTVEKDGKFALIKDVPLILNVSSGSTPAAQGAPSNVLKDKVESTASNSGTVTDKLSQRKLTPSPTPLPAVQPETGSPWSGIRRWFRSLF